MQHPSKVCICMALCVSVVLHLRLSNAAPDGVLFGYVRARGWAISMQSGYDPLKCTEGISSEPNPVAKDSAASSTSAALGVAALSMLLQTLFN